MMEFKIKYRPRVNYHANRLDGLEHTWRSVIQCEDLFTRDIAVVVDSVCLHLVGPADHADDTAVAGIGQTLTNATEITTGCCDHKHTEPLTHVQRTRIQAHAHAHARTHARTQARMHARAHTHTHTHTHTYPQAFIHTYTHTHTLSLSLSLSPTQKQMDKRPTGMHVRTHTPTCTLICTNT